MGLEVDPETSGDFSSGWAAGETEQSHLDTLTTLFLSSASSDTEARRQVRS